MTGKIFHYGILPSTCRPGRIYFILWSLLLPKAFDDSFMQSMFAQEPAMSDSFNVIVPERFTFTTQELTKLEKRMIGWMQTNGWIEKKKSDCVYNKDKGWRFTPDGAKHMAKNGEYLDYLGYGAIYGVSVEKLDGLKGIFTNMEGGLESAVCPACAKDVLKDIYDMISDWANAKEYYPLKCPQCGAASDIRDYKLYPPWGFSQLGFEFWNLGIIDPDFVREFSTELGEPVRVVWGTL